MAIGGEFTRRLLVDAGLTKGQRLLDMGCGTGDVALLAADLVGPSGQVVGLDSDTCAITAARGRAQGLPSVTFVEGDLSVPPEGLGRFDVIVGRRVVMYLPDPVATLRSVATLLHPGGLMVLHEHDSTMTPVSTAALPLHRQARAWVRAMLEHEGADLHIGFNLYGLLTAAGLTAPHVRAEAIVQTPLAAYPLFSIIRAVLPRLIAHGVVTADEVDIDTLEQRLDEERITSDATYIGDMMFGAWAMRPATQSA